MSILYDRVRRGIALLDEKIPDWPDKAGDPNTLDMMSRTDCLLCRVTEVPNYNKALGRVSVLPGSGAKYGFSATITDHNELNRIWREEIQKRRDQRGEKPEYPYTYHGSPARIIEENLVGRPGLVVIAHKHNAGCETIAVVNRLDLKEREKITLRFGQRFYYDGMPRLITAMPGCKALLINPDIGAWCMPTVSFRKAQDATFTPEDFGLRSKEVIFDD